MFYVLPSYISKIPRGQGRVNGDFSVIHWASQFQILWDLIFISLLVKSSTSLFDKLK